MSVCQADIEFGENEMFVLRDNEWHKIDGFVRDFKAKNYFTITFASEENHKRFQSEMSVKKNVDDIEIKQITLFFREGDQNHHNLM